MVSGKDEVSEFLTLAKALVLGNHWAQPFEDDLDVLTLIGLTTMDVRDILLQLECTHYCKGPEPDDDPQRPGEVWFFLANAPDSVVELYVKLKVTPNRDYLVVLSMHPPAHPIIRPYRKG